MEQGSRGLDIDLLLTLDALLKDGNVTHAAKRLHITQSALSGRLTRLRQIMNDPLFVPSASGRGVIPTPHALAIREDLEQLLDRINQFSREVRIFDPATSDRVFRIAASDNPATMLIPDLLASVVRQAPAVRIAVVVPDIRRIGEMLEKGEIDLYVGLPMDLPPDLICRTLFDDELVTAQRIDHPRGTGPLTLDEFCALDHVLISSDGGGFSGVIDGALAELGRSRKVRLSVQSYALAPVVVGSTDCVCTLPRRLLARFGHSLDLFPPPLTLGKFILHSVWHPTMAEDAAHRWLRQMVQSVAVPVD